MQSFYGEVWKIIEFDDAVAPTTFYKISNFGRVVSTYSGKEVLLKCGTIGGYKTLSIKKKGGGRITRYVHKLVAQNFLERKKDDEFVIHLNYNKTDNRVENLKWATKEEKEHHQFSNPKYKGIRKDSRSYSKLTESQVRHIKKMINDPNRKTRLKMIAKRFGVSEMQLYRIKSGENWGHIE